MDGRQEEKLNEGLQEYAKRLRETGQLEGAAYAPVYAAKITKIMYP